MREYKMKESKSVLIVEDDAIIAMSLEFDFIQEGYTIYKTFSTGEETVNFLKKNIDPQKPDIILMDIRLAGAMDGVQTASRIRQLSKAPIIFMTGYSTKNYEKEAMQVANTAYLVKPIYIHDVKKVIESFL